MSTRRGPRQADHSTPRSGLSLGGVGCCGGAPHVREQVTQLVRNIKGGPVLLVGGEPGAEYFAQLDGCLPQGIGKLTRGDRVCRRLDERPYIDCPSVAIVEPIKRVERVRGQFAISVGHVPRLQPWVLAVGMTDANGAGTCAGSAASRRTDDFCLPWRYA